MQKTSFNILLNFLRGASWALVIIIATYLFFHMLYLGFFIALSSALFGSFVGFFFVVFFELAHLIYKKIELQEEQLNILKEINGKINRL